MATGPNRLREVHDRFIRLVLLPIAALLVTVSAIAALALAWTAHGQDQRAALEQARLVAGTFELRQRELMLLGEAFSIWDDAVERMHTTVDPEWIEGNVVMWSGNSEVPSTTLLLDPSGRTAYAWVDGARAGDEVRARFAAILPALLERLRASPMRQAAAMVVDRGTPAFILASQVRSQHAVPPPLDSPMSVLVLVKPVDAATLALLAQIYGLPGLRFEPASLPGAGRVALAGADGAPVGDLVWEPARPGRDVLIGALPALLCGLAATLTLGGFVLWHAKRTGLMLQSAEAMALHDRLTGLPNRALLEDRIEQLIGAVRRRVTRFSVLCVDLDGFKAVNDRLGHAAGDALLREVAERMRAELRAEDTVARVGGDEFVTVLPGLDPAAAASVAERLIAAVARPMTIDGAAVAVGASVGIATAPEDGTELDVVLRRADAALYAAKAAGRGTWRQVVTDPPASALSLPALATRVAAATG